MINIRKLFKIDPIVTELLKAGLTTYKKHYKAYFILNISYIVIFAIILGITSPFGSNMVFLSQIFNAVNSVKQYTQTLFFYGLIGLLITVVTYYIAFRETLRSGELGFEIQTPWTAITHFIIIFFYNLLVIMYLVVWVFFYQILFYLVTFNNLQLWGENSYPFVFLSLIVVIILLIAMFLFVVKLSYYIYMLDELKVPTQALDPIIFFFGLGFGFLMLFLELANFFMPSNILADITIIITYLTPGTVIMPILGYSMAHLKVAQTVLGFEPLFMKEEPSIN